MTLTVDDFTPHIGTEFIARDGAFEDRLTLVEAKASQRAAPDGFRQPFSLVFEGIRDDMMIVNLIEFEHPALGSMPLTPSALGHSKSGGFVYQVVFN